MLAVCLTLIPAAQSRGEVRATGKITLEGALTSSTLSPAAGDEVVIYFNATPLKSVDSVKLRITLPPGIEAPPGANLENTWSKPAEGGTLTLATIVRVVTPGEHTITASGALIYPRGGTESRALVLTIRARPSR